MTRIRSLLAVVAVLAVLMVLTAEVVSVRPGWAIPAFSRKYNFSCKDCHVGASAQLNEFGQILRDQGYQLPRGHGQPSAQYQRKLAEAAAPDVLFENYCVTCHGMEGKGDGPMGVALLPPVPDLTSQQSREKSDAELLTIIREGSANTAMPGFTRYLNDQQLRNLLAYVRSLSE